MTDVHIEPWLVPFLLVCFRYSLPMSSSSIIPRYPSWLFVRTGQVTFPFYVVTNDPKIKLIVVIKEKEDGLPLHEHWRNEKCTFSFSFRHKIWRNMTPLTCSFRSRRTWKRKVNVARHEKHTQIHSLSKIHWHIRTQDAHEEFPDHFFLFSLVT